MLLFIGDYNAIRAVSSVRKLERDIPIREGLFRVPHKILILELVRKGKFILLCCNIQYMKMRRFLCLVEDD